MLNAEFCKYSKINYKGFATLLSKIPFPKKLSPKEKRNIFPVCKYTLRILQCWNQKGCVNTSSVKIQRILNENPHLCKGKQLIVICTSFASIALPNSSLQRKPYKIKIQRIHSTSCSYTTQRGNSEVLGCGLVRSANNKLLVTRYKATFRIIFLRGTRTLTQGEPVCHTAASGHL